MSDSVVGVRVAAVILNWNGWRKTVPCLKTVLGQERVLCLPVVVDNGSSDCSLERLRAWAGNASVEVTNYARGEVEAGGVAAGEANPATVGSGRRLVLITAGSNLGFAAGTNVGLRYVLAHKYPFVLLLNNDVTLEPGVVATLLEALERHPTWAGVAPKVLDRGAPERILYAGGRVRLWQARATHIGRFAADSPAWAGERATGHLTLCCALYRAEFLRAAGLLDEDFFFGQEDVALSCLAQRLGWRLGVQLDAKVVHNEGHSLEDQPATSVYYYAKYRVLLLTKYGAWWQIITGTVFLIATRLPKFAWLVLRGRARLVRAELRGYCDAFAGRFGDYDREAARASS